MEEQLELVKNSVGFWPVATVAVHIYDRVPTWIPVSAQDQMRNLFRDGAKYVIALRVVLRESLN